MERSHVFLIGSPHSIGEEVSYYCCRQYTADERQRQREAAGYVQRTGPSGGPGFRRELTRRGLLDRLGQSGKAYRVKDSFGDGEGDVPVGVGSVEDQNPLDDDSMGASGVGVLKRVIKWQIPVFDGKTTSRRRFEMGFLIARRQLCLDYVLSGDNEGIPVADRTISLDGLNAHYGSLKVAKRFAVWSLISNSLKTDADKRVSFSTKSPGGWLGQGRFFSCRNPRSEATLQSKGS